MKKCYVVYVGKNPGVYDTWSECSFQVTGFSGASFKSFPISEKSKRESELKEYLKEKETRSSSKKATKKDSIPTGSYLTVDAAFSSKTRILEWRGVLVSDSSKKEVFHSPSGYIGGSANVGEFLAILDGLFWMEDHNINLPIYSDSKSAQAWLRDRRNGSGVHITGALKSRFQGAMSDLISGQYDELINKYSVFDWDTRSWGEIPADFGRK